MTLLSTIELYDDAGKHDVEVTFDIDHGEIDVWSVTLNDRPAPEWMQGRVRQLARDVPDLLTDTALGTHEQAAYRAFEAEHMAQKEAAS
jgi:hypothetical protein